MLSLKTKDWQINDIETVLFDKDGTLIDLHYFWGKMTELRVLEVIKTFNLDKKYLNELCLCLGFDLISGRMKEDGITALYSRAKIIEIFTEELQKYNINTTTQKLTGATTPVSQ